MRVPFVNSSLVFKMEKMKNSLSEKKVNPKKSHYVDNDTLVTAIEDYKKDIAKAEKNQLPKPRMSEYLGTAIYEIANRLSFKDRFASYTYREELVSDAIENCIMYITNFDSSISKYAFAYITQICYHAFFRRIMREKKQQYVKLKLIEQAGIPGVYDLSTNDESFDKFNKLTPNKLIEDCKIIIDKEAELDKIKEKKRRANKKKKALELLM